jgi:hypothetical protein
MTKIGSDLNYLKDALDDQISDSGDDISDVNARIDSIDKYLHEVDQGSVSTGSTIPVGGGILWSVMNVSNKFHIAIFYPGNPPGSGTIVPAAYDEVNTTIDVVSGGVKRHMVAEYVRANTGPYTGGKIYYKVYEEVDAGSL